MLAVTSMSLCNKSYIVVTSITVTASNEVKCNASKYIVPNWENNVVDARAAGAINNAARLLGEANGCIQKTPIIVQQPAINKEQVVVEFLNCLPGEYRNPIAAYLQRLVRDREGR